MPAAASFLRGACGGALVHHAQRGQRGPRLGVLQLAVQALALDQVGDVAPVRLQAELQLPLGLQWGWGQRWCGAAAVQGTAGQGGTGRLTS